MSGNYYLELELKLRDDSEVVLTPDYILGSIEQSLESFFGEFGGRTDLEILDFDEETKRVILKVPEPFYKRTETAISLIGEFQSIPCHFLIHQASTQEISGFK